MTKIAKGWSEVSLLDVAPIKSKLVDPRLPDFSRMILIAPDHIESKTGRIIEKVTAHEQGAISGKFHVKKGSVIYSKIRPYLMKATIVNEDVLCSADMYPLECTEEVIPEYLLNVLLSKFFTDFSVSCSNRTGIPKINREELSFFSFNLPPRSVQIAIAGLLSTWDLAIEKTERLIAAKERRFKSLIESLILAPASSEGKWKALRICEIADRVRRRSDEGTYPILTISSASGFVLQEEKYSRYMAGKSVENYILLRRGEFAYNKGNSLRYQFGCVFALTDFDMALVPHVYVCFKVRDGVNLEYLGHLFAADFLKRQLGTLVKTGVRNNGLLNIRPDEFMNATVPLPPADQQKSIAAILNAASTEIKLLKKQLNAFGIQKRGLMQKLLTGRWRVSA